MGDGSIFVGSKVAELSKRVKAIDTAWAKLGKYWTSNTPLKRKRLAFLAVFEAAISGNQAVVFSKTDYCRLDAKVATYGRVVLKGDTYEEEEGKKIRWDTTKVLRRLGYDLSYLEYVDGDEALLEELGGSIGSIFTNESCLRRFLNIDLRQVSLSRVKKYPLQNLFPKWTTRRISCIQSVAIFFKGMGIYVGVSSRTKGYS